MFLTKDTEYSSFKSDYISISCMTLLGDREDQQDSLGYESHSDSSLAVLCDGMGGHKGGKFASSLTVKAFISEFSAASELDDPVSFLCNNAISVNERVKQASIEEGFENAGTTMVSVIVCKNQLYWCSVGDSRAYIIRNGAIVQLTQDHNYKTVLDGQLREGIITEEDYQSEIEFGSSLISFIGIDGDPLVDYNNAPLNLIKDDIIVIMSDGLYKLVSDEEILRIISNCSNPDDALELLKIKSEKISKKSITAMDNTSVIIIKLGGVIK